MSSGYRGSPLTTSAQSNLSMNSDATDTRKRQNKRDEAIRKKVELELQRKSGKAPSTPTASSRRRKQQHASRGPAATPGTVSALRPLPALTVPQTISVADASQLCAAKRTDCVLVVDEDEHLAGIFTAKDLAFRVVAGGLDARTTPVSEIMTRSPMVTRDTTSATEALNTMVTRGFRHLPVCNEDGDVIGLLDIAKVFYEALEKLERAHGSSQKLYNALEGVQSEWGTGAVGPQQAMLQYIEALRDKMSIPDLSSILDSRTLPCTVSVRTTVREAAKLMKDHHTTAVCVMESSAPASANGGVVQGKIAGIFTSKDVVLRVIAAGLDPKSCSVVRVMTPHPDTAPPTMSIQEALRKMHDGRYLNLPVVDTDTRLVAVVDVLKLTYKTLEQINSMAEESEQGGSGGAGGPMWNRFWNSFGQTGSTGSGSAAGGAGGGDDTESALSGSQRPSEYLNEIPSTPGRHAGGADISSDLHPNDSASAVGAAMHEDAASALGFGISSAGPGGVGAVDDGTYLFKFTTPGRKTHRFQARYDTYDTIREIVGIKLGADDFFATPPRPSPPDAEGESGSGVNGKAAYAQPDPDDFTLAYEDDENDVVLITADGDVQDAVNVARKQGRDRVVLLVQGGRTWEEALAHYAAPSATVPAASSAHGKRRQRDAVDAQLQSVEEEEEREDQADVDGGSPNKPRAIGVAATGSRKSAAGRKEGEDLLFGVLPRDMAMPAAISFLGVAVVAAVVLTRSSSSR
ncbi:CBS-domain-containing protein [Tilletiaria anomala UBC 951]|uniref:CBS-domain-containing protein n=1 Tax=Tilletiaria anomala (strain ATCC 24038 / CBS 436.72 / UBC 951) TaxID=1037660 RepID=A0A066WLU6_TILAU|nr:CBS-domain-containing protein [Tilletiaria anomala UBC 951]KDN53568.1 CBS-domain-containing protein [Tilletiaria anomala UBC 951]